MSRSAVPVLVVPVDKANGADSAAGCVSITMQNVSLVILVHVDPDALLVMEVCSSISNQTGRGWACGSKSSSVHSVKKPKACPAGSGCGLRKWNRSHTPADAESASAAGRLCHDS